MISMAPRSWLQTSASEAQVAIVYLVAAPLTFRVASDA
jgi:hypothetical protein